MHICFVTRNFDAPYLGGRNLSLRYIEKELRGRGHKVTIISTAYEKKKKEWPENIIFVDKGRHYYPDLLHSIKKLKTKLEEVHKNTPIDIVHSCEREFAGMAARFFWKNSGVPYVQWAYDGGYFTQRRQILNTVKSPLKYPMMWYMKYAEKKVLENARFIATIGRDISRSLIERGFDENKVIFIGNTVDTEKFKPKKSTLQDELKTKKKIISYIGRINKNKRTEWFVKIAELVNKKTDECLFVVAGNDKDGYKAECKSYQKKLGVKNLKWIGQRSDVVNVINGSYCVVSTMYKYGFGAGNILLESMACGVPVVHSDVSAAVDVIKTWENGVLWDRENPQEAADAIVKLVKDKKLRDKMGDNARRTILEENSVDTIVNRLEKMYGEVMTT